jgi:hypothetical protein
MGLGVLSILGHLDHHDLINEAKVKVRNRT